MDPFSLLGFGAGIIGGIGKMFGRGRANRRLRELEKMNPSYQENPLAKERLGLARTLLNARAPGAASAERNIFTNQANTFSNVSGAATDASQLLSSAGNIQGQTNEAIGDLQSMEAQDYQRRYGNVVGAQEGVINEQDKVFQDKVRRFQDTAQISGAINQNQQSNWGDVSNLGFGLMNFGLAGGFDKMFGGGGGNSGGNPQFSYQSNPTSFSQLQGNPNIDPRLAGSSYPQFRRY